MSRPVATDLVLWNRAFKRVQFSRDACWEWSGTVARSGYGVLNWRGVLRYAHRIAWEFWHGAVPVGMDVLHRCDHRKCVRPEHLFLGTNQDNIDDKVAKGRQKKGRLIAFGGEALHIAEWARRTGLRAPTISYRLRKGWSVERALTVRQKT